MKNNRMKSIVTKSRVCSNGLLHLSVPIGLAQADTEVKVTVEPLSKATTLTRFEWSNWVDSMAGCWHGEFERLPQQTP